MGLFDFFKKGKRNQTLAELDLAISEKTRELDLVISEKSKKIEQLDENIFDRKAFIEEEEVRIIKAMRELEDNRDALLHSMKAEAKAEIEKEMLEVKCELSCLKAETVMKKDELDKSNKTIISNANKVQKFQMQAKALQAMIKKTGDESYILSAEDERLIDHADDLLSTTVELRLHYMDVRQLKTLFNQNKKIINDTLTKYQSRYTTKALASLYKLMVLALEAELQNVLFELRFGKLDKAINNVQTITSKYKQIASDGNQNIAPTIAKFIAEIEYLYIEAVKIEYEYYTKKEAIKEEQRALREQMRQEAEERKQLELERRRIEAEEEKFKNEMANIAAQLESINEESQRTALEARMVELQGQMKSIEERKESISKLQHGKAGTVYIVSNLGSFGDSVFKIGMTRRLNLEDRMSELNGASVPFPFDIHASIFSEDAAGLENSLHKSLHKKRLNKVNLRKEFFKVSLLELEESVYTFQPTAEFITTMLAEQYNQSLSMGDDDIPEDLIVCDDFDDDSDDVGIE